MNPKFTENGQGIVLSQCVYCKHYKRGRGKCTAYQDGIPAKILANQADHRQPLRGDHGIQFEAADGTLHDDLERLAALLGQNAAASRG